MLKILYSTIFRECFVLLLLHNITSTFSALKPFKIVLISCGRAHTIAASDSGAIFAWGYNGDGQLGTGDRNDKEIPVKILTLSARPVQLAAGSNHSMLLSEAGNIFVWGSNEEGQLGTESDIELIPIKISLLTKIRSISCGYYHSLALSESGDVLAWGEAGQGQLGLPETLIKNHSKPQLLNVGEKVVMVTAGSSHSVVLTETGRLLTCGSGTDGQLGQGGKCTSQQCLKPVADENNFKFIYVNSGDNHSAAISDNGLVYTWGCGRHGKLCLGEQNFSTQFLPVLVTRLRHLSAVKVSCGGCHTMVLGYRRLEREGPPLNLPTAWETSSITSKTDSKQSILKSSIFKRPIEPSIPTNGMQPEEDSVSHESVCNDSEPLENSSDPGGGGGRRGSAMTYCNELELTPTGRSKALRKKTPGSGYGGSSELKMGAFEKKNIIPLDGSEEEDLVCSNHEEKLEERRDLHDAESSASTPVTGANTSGLFKGASDGSSYREAENIPQLEDIEGEVENEKKEVLDIPRSPVENIVVVAKSRTCILL